MGKPKGGKESIPDVEVGDEVYFHHPKKGPHWGSVIAHGKHGATLSADGGRHRVRWDRMLGHKVRVRPEYKVLADGEDGLVVEGNGGRRKFISDSVHEEPVRKSNSPILMLFGIDDDLFKAIKDKSGLTLQGVTDKSGHQTKRWKKTSPDQPAVRDKAAPEAGASSGFGTHNIEAGDGISFEMGSLKGEGKVVAAGKDGATVVDAAGREHNVHWREVTDHRPGGERQKAKVEPEVRGDHDAVEPDKFSAADFAKAHDKADVTPEEILAHFPADTTQKIMDAQQRLTAIEQTISMFKKDGNYTAARSKIHDKIVEHFLSPANIESARPVDGERPKFVILGGRGGSGKSSLKGKVYDPSKAIVLDADEIKAMLPEYEGWNAAQVHEESGDLFEAMTEFALMQGLNLVHDATMKTSGKAVALVKEFKGAGYTVEAHYMHLPRQEAAKRAVSRFLGATGRYVPVEVVLGNTGNEEAFDEVRKHVDAWSFHDNNVPKGQPPVLISESGGSDTGKGKDDNSGASDLKKPENGSKSSS
ncbi:zeta toxin family protein [Parvibaculum sp.]|uniref:zeta toxin family protein n=1 Tax=Parvibaculum sp. TaxID=2024848 RepID=UPI002735F40D|nr:zeta toxin family protein [Parvibaculum sp.]MDP3327181.1 zeta toxin family protein [Parvibaculum sp.]